MRVGYCPDWGLWRRLPAGTEVSTFAETPVKDCINAPWKGFAPCRAERVGALPSGALPFFLSCRGYASARGGVIAALTFGTRKADNRYEEVCHARSGGKSILGGLEHGQEAC